MSQENINKTLLGSLAVLIVLAAGLFFYGGKREDVDKNLFKVTELSQVDKVVLASNGKTVALSFNGAKWKVNEKYAADDQLVTVLFATLQQVEPKRKVSGRISDSLSNYLRSKGVKVSLFEGEEEVRRFYAGGNKAKTEAYFLDEAEGAYVMTIPGYRVYVAGVFEVDEGGWRDKRVFDFNWRNFKRLEAQFASQPSQNFSIEDQGNGFDLAGSAPSDTTRLNDYLDAVSLLVARQFLTMGSNLSYDSLLRTEPEVTIRVFDLGENVHQLELYRPMEGEGEVLGRKDATDVVLFDLEQVLPVLKKREYFKR